MPCIAPVVVYNAGRRDSVPCGKCNFCLQAKRADWTFRLTQELKMASTSMFLTLTYEDGEMPLGSDDQPSLYKRDVQLFKKRLRKVNSDFTRDSIRYYTVGEYGSLTARPHYHSIMFNVDRGVVPQIASIWKNGICYVGDVTPASIHYVAKYCINRVGDYSGREPPFSVMSRKPGIGNAYLATHGYWHLEGLRGYTMLNGFKQRMPRYYKDKLFSVLEKNTMAIENFELSENQFAKEIERLAEFCDDPYAHYAERVTASHDRIMYNPFEKSKL